MGIFRGGSGRGIVRIESGFRREKRGAPKEVEKKPESFKEWLPARSSHWRWDARHHLLLTERLEALARVSGVGCGVSGRAEGLAEERASPPAPPELVGTGLLRGEVSPSHGNGKLMIFMPPRHGKSEMATIRFGAYLLEQNPALRIILGAHTEKLAAQFSRKMRRLVRGIGQLSGECSGQTEWETSAGGGLRAVGVGTGVVGFGADAIVIDDPIKGRQEADSLASRDRVWEWYCDDLMTRQEPNCTIILIQTRWHEDDLAGRILRSDEGEDWDVLRLPAFAETQEERDAWADRNHRPLGQPDPLGREIGEVIWPERWPKHKLEPFRQRQGGSFMAMFQQTPVAATGGLFKRERFHIIDEPPAGLRKVRFWDTAAKAGEQNDYTVGACCAMNRNGDLYILNVVRGRWEYPDMKRTILQTAKADGERVLIGIEDTANGTAILQDLKRDEEARERGYLIKECRVRADKVVRAGLWGSLVQDGKVYLVKGEWNLDFLDEAVMFPAGGHDDQIDAVSGAYQLMMENRAFGPNPITLPVMGRDYVRGAAPRCLVPW